MNRRRLLIALAVLVPLAVFGAAKWAARFRPVVIGALVGKTRYYSSRTSIRASADSVVVGGSPWEWNRFELGSGTHRVVRHETLVEDGGQTLKLRADAKGQVQLLSSRDGGAPIVFDLPGTFASPGTPVPGTLGPANDNAEARTFARQTARVSPQFNRVELFSNGIYYRWNLATRRSERVADLNRNGHLTSYEMLSHPVWALARDGESVVLPTMEAISRFSTRSGQRTSRLKLPVFARFIGDVYATEVSPYGGYAFYLSKATGQPLTARVFDTRRPRALWSVGLSRASLCPIAWAPDEKTLALAQPLRRQWEIRDLKTGAILRTLPLVTNAQAAAFAPDGNTLYSVANGVLYRQRAR